MDKTLRSHSALFVAALLISVPVSAVPTLVTGADAPPCDVLAIPTTVLDELGTVPPFPVGEQILTGVVNPPGGTACTSLTADNPLIDNVVVGIINLNAVAFSDLWYVADYTTTLTNADGVVVATPPVPAFKIDAVGLNAPLIFESGVVDGIFSPGEIWNFIIQDYTNTLALSADLLSTIGLPSAGLGSSGSIVAVPVPEPTTAALLGVGLAGMSLVRRRAR